VYPSGSYYGVTSLHGTQLCADGTTAMTCTANRIDFGLAPASLAAQEADILKRVAQSPSDPADAMLILHGQWATVLANDHRYTPPRVYTSYWFRVLDAYASDTPRHHATTFYHA
jgi:hypothetical protein